MSSLEVRLCKAAALCVAAASAVVACASANDEGRERPAGPGLLDAKAGVMVVEGGRQDAQAEEEPPPANPLCGVGSCGGFLPDDDSTAVCEGFDAGWLSPPGPSGSEAGSPDGTGGGTVPDANLAADAAPDASDAQDGGSISDADSGPDAGAVGRDASVSSDADAAMSDGLDASLDATLDGSGVRPPPAAEPIVACHVRREGNRPVHRCDRAGRADVGDPCISSRDCRPGLGCVGENNSRCLPFCCRSDDVCEPDTYCAPRPLRDDAEPEPLMVPVCVEGDNCALDEPYPCDQEATRGGCTCSDGKACTVVRSDGTTACVLPGEGRTGDPCPCAPGYFCSLAMQACVKLCRTDRQDQCGTGRCQATASFPQGLGLCVSTTSDDG